MVRLLCDSMLGRLAKWLRAAGHDVYYAREGTNTSDRFLTHKALEEGRALLTSDGDFLERKPVRDGTIKFLLIPQNTCVEEQLTLVRDSFGLERLDPRCMECGGELEAVSPEEVESQVPEAVLHWNEEFFRCVECGRVFWYGSHWTRIGDRLERVFG